MLNLEELKDVIVYLVYCCDLLHLPEYAIQKLIFLAEIESYKTTGTRLTEADFKSYAYGPFSQDIRNALQQLRDDSRVRFRHHCTLSKRAYVGVEATLQTTEVPNISQEKLSILEAICKKWGSKRPEEMVRHIYRTYIYASTPYDHYYEFEKITRELVDEKIDEDEVANSEMLKEEEKEFLHLIDIRPPKNKKVVANPCGKN